jgi:hypothetical protein
MAGESIKKAHELAPEDKEIVLQFKDIEEILAQKKEREAQVLKLEQTSVEGK